MWILATIKIFNYFRVYSTFGKYVHMLKESLNYVKPFATFLLVLLLAFSIILPLSGYELRFEDEEYKGMSREMAFLIYTWRTSIGDGKLPRYEFWSSKSGYAPEVSSTMIQICWTIWFSNSILS